MNGDPSYFAHNAKRPRREAVPEREIVEFRPARREPSYVVEEHTAVEDVQRFIRAFILAGGSIP